METSNGDFAAWIQARLDERGWIQATLVSEAQRKGYKLSTAQLSRVMNREQMGGGDFCMAVADGLGVPREEVFRARGWLLPLAMSEVDRELAAVLRTLESDDKRMLLRMARGLRATVPNGGIPSQAPQTQSAQLAGPGATEVRNTIYQIRIKALEMLAAIEGLADLLSSLLALEGTGETMAGKSAKELIEELRKKLSPETLKDTDTRSGSKRPTPRD